MPEISKTADHALAVLLEVGESGPTTPAVLAKTLGLNRTVVHRLLSTLHQRGFVTRQDRGYVPGPLLVRIADRVQPEMRAVSRATIEGLAHAVEETVVIHIADGRDAVVLAQVVPETNIVRVLDQIGSRHPLGIGAAGRALLAFMPQDAIDRIVRESPRPTDLGRQLDAVHQLGYALSHDELQHGVHGLSVPVLDGSQYALASMTMLAPTNRANRLLPHLDALLAASATVSTMLQSGPRG